MRALMGPGAGERTQTTTKANGRRLAPALYFGMRSAELGRLMPQGHPRLTKWLTENQVAAATTTISRGRSAAGITNGARSRNG